MTNTQSVDSDTDSIIQELHRVREAIVDSFGGDLHKLTADARERQSRSGQAIWRGKQSSQRVDQIPDGKSAETDDSSVCHESP
ncbi:MAG: hypothetical protein GXX96_23455 [Planctomycetaceae bacterium]|nr:hypothetical protein [Planctomycetaceae bacterium]